MMYKQETRDPSNIQSHHRNYLSEIRGDNNKLLEDISKTGDILIQYYANGQNKETLSHQYLILTGNCYACNKHNIIGYYNQKDVMFVKNETKSNKGQYKSINHIKNMLKCLQAKEWRDIPDEILNIIKMIYEKCVQCQ